LDCATSIDSACYRIVIGAFDGGNPAGTPYEHEARRRGLCVVRIHERRSIDLNVLKQIIDLGREHDAEIVHAHDFRSDLFGFAAARVLRVPFISTAHGWISNDLKGRISTRLDKLILRQADHVISVSDQTRKQLGRWANHQRCTVIPNALRIGHYKIQRAPSHFRASRGIADDELLIANVGRLSPEKGQLLFLEAARDVARRFRRLRFVLFGIGPDQALLERFINENDMHELVILAGYRNDMDQLYNEIDLIVQSSTTEGMPNVILEALLMQVPVIATDVGGTGEIVKHGATGVLIPSCSKGALVSAIEGFLTNRQMFDAMAKKGRDDVIFRFNHERRVEKLTAVYDNLVRPRTRPG